MEMSVLVMKEEHAAASRAKQNRVRLDTTQKPQD
jgi:hypothetical protein